MEQINLNELTLENVGQWPLPVKIGAVVLTAGLIIFFGYWYFISASIETYDRAVAKETTLKQEFEAKQQLAANLQAYRNQLNQMNEKFGNMLRQLPAKHEMPGLLEDISNTGRIAGLRFELFAPQPEVMYDFYVELPIKIRVVGTYHQIAVFLSEVAKMSRIVTLHEIDMGLSAKDDRQKSTVSNDITMDITAKIYRYRSI